MGGGKGSSGSSKTTTTTTPPPYIAAAYQDILSKAKDVYNLPLEQYGGPQLAGFTPDQEASFNTVRNAGGIFQPYADAAQSMATSGSQDIWSQLPSFSADEISKYFNPYEDSVVSSTIEDMRRTNALQQQDLIGNAVSAGAWGGSSADDARMNLAYDQTKANSGILAGIRQGGYKDAINTYLTEKAAQANALATTGGLKMQGAGIIGNLGNSAFGNTMAQAGALGENGALQQDLVQKQLNIPYEQFLQQQAYPYENLQYYANIAAALGGGAGGTTTGTGKAPGQGSSGIGNALGTAASLASLFLKDGGRVAPSITNRKGSGIVPTDGFITAHMGAPAATALPTESNAGSPMGGFQNLGGILDGGFATGWGDAMDRGADTSGAMRSGIYAARGGFGPYKDGGKVLDYRSGGRVKCYADGGEVDPLTQSGTPVAGFKPVVAGTPVFAFDPRVAKANSIAMSPRIPVPPQNSAAKPNSSAMGSLWLDREGGVHSLGSSSYLDMAKKAQPNKLLGMLKAGNALYEGKSDLLSEWGWKPAAYQNGGIVSYARGGDVEYPGGPEIAPGAEYLTRRGILPLALQKNMARSYIPSAKPIGSSLNAPGAMSAPMAAQAPRTGMVKADPDGFVMSPPGEVFGPPAPEKFGPPNPFISDEQAAKMGGKPQYANKLDRALSEPWRTALLFGGANMIGQTGDPASVVGNGILAGVANYANSKKVARDAEAEARKLVMETEKFRREMDLKDKEIQIKERELEGSDYTTVEGSDDILVLDKKTGNLKSSGMKPKPKGTNIDVSAKDVNDIESAALSMIPGALSPPDAKGNQSVRPDVYETLGPKMMAARDAASKVYQQTRDSQAGLKAYLEALGVDPASDEYFPGEDNSMVGRMLGAKPDGAGRGIRKNKTAVLAEAKAAIAQGAPKDKVIQRLKDNGIDPKGL